ncbi:ABC transporter ATP-binding protein [Chryseobacterium sp. 6424]|uniref:HAD family hydrolase n=1 Tax=Chryseobacterium sp. 6424 TaxID=2039166 RepID=UPI000EFB9F2F|nr:HAD family phosphatase [Chryseobacterium sp. 6424]AYO58500.1 ABC transporter ATP-binding protein [Chryseobacterium sp. 6424]
MPLKAILFDMDGVIVDTEPLHRKAYFKMFEDLNISVSEKLYTSFTGASTQKVCTTLVEKFSLNSTHEELASIKRRYFKHYFDHDADFDLLPGVKDLIENYFDNGLKVILASSAHMNTINWVFEKFRLEKYFSGKISGADLKESKPHPEIFQLAAEMAGEPTENCLVIEDSTNGIMAAHAAGIFCAAYKSPHSKDQNYELANILVEDFAHLKLPKIQRFF